MENKRIEYLDIAKGIAIICVIIGHSCGDITRSIIYTFHMPLFFIISGYFCKGKVELVKNTKKLIVPYVITCITMVLLLMVLNVFSGRYITHNVQEWIISAVLGKGSGAYAIGAIWFLVALYIGKSILNLIVKIKKRWIQVLLVIGTAGLGLITNISLFSISVALTSVIWLYLGYIAKEKEIFNKKIPANYYVIMCAFWLICIQLGLMNGNMLLVNNTYPNGIINILGGVVASFLVIKLSQKIACSNILKKPLLFYGKNSLTILCIHIIELNILHLNLIFTNTIILNIVKLILITSIAFVISSLRMKKIKEFIAGLLIMGAIVLFIVIQYMNKTIVVCLGDSITYGARWNIVDIQFEKFN